MLSGKYTVPNANGGGAGAGANAGSSDTYGHDRVVTCTCKASAPGVTIYGASQQPAISSIKDFSNVRLASVDSSVSSVGTDVDPNGEGGW